MGDAMFATMFSAIFVFMFFGLIIGSFIALAVYFLPIIIAAARKHNELVAICLINVFLGWTFLGWLASILWSLNSDVKGSLDEISCE